MEKLLLSFLSSFIFITGCNSQPLTSSQIDTLVERTMKAFDVPGIAVGIIKDGKIIHAKGYGVRSLKTREKVDENTLFGIASNTKAFTAAALGILVDEGKLNWDDKVTDYIPEFRLYNSFVTEEFTIRDLLTHRSGLGLGAGDLMLVSDSSDFVLKDIIYNLRFLKPVSSFRSKFDYDNNLYIVAGEIIARVSGKSWEDFVAEKILIPLGMVHSAACFDCIKDKSNLINAHAAVNNKVQVIPILKFKIGNAAGGIYSNITDLSKWILFQLHHGKYGEGLTQKIFSEQVHKEMWTPQTLISPFASGPYNRHFMAYGLGFFITDQKGYEQLSHTGGLPGNLTQITNDYPLFGIS